MARKENPTKYSLIVISAKTSDLWVAWRQVQLPSEYTPNQQFSTPQEAE